MQRRILLLLTDLEIGGTPTVVRELAFRLHRAGAHIEVVALSKPGPLQNQLWERGIKCTALGARGTWDIRIARRLSRLMRQEKIDTLFSFLIHANALAALMRLRHPGVRHLQSIQTTQPNPLWHWSLQRLIAPAAEKIIVPSPSVAAIAARRSGISPRKIAIISNAIDPADFRGTGYQPVKPIQNIGFIGRLDPIKRIPDLLQAMTLLPAETTLQIFGQGSEQPKLQSLIQKLNLSHRVKLHGPVPHPEQALAQIDLLVLPSQAEGFGLVLIEAMAAGVPVVATNVPGIRDVVKHQETGLLVPVASPQALATAISQISHDANLRQRLIQNAQADVQARFTWDSVLTRYFELLRML